MAERKKPEPAPKPTAKAAPKSAAIIPTNYGPPGNPHDQFVADMIKGLQDGSIVLRSVDARRVTSHPGVELMVELLDMGPPGVLPGTGPGVVLTGVTGATGPATSQAYHLAPSAVTALGGQMSSSAVSMSAGSMMQKVANLPGAKTYGLKQSKGVEPIVGYRDFKLIQGLYGLALQSRNGAIWQPRKKMMAMCDGNPFANHDVPEPTCQCGIYAYAKPDDSSLQRDNSSLWGEIAMWGEVLICESGFRAEFAYPTALFMRKPAMPGNRTTRVLEAVREELEDSYGVPVFILAERASKTASQLMQEILQEQLGDLLNQTKEEK